MEKKKHRYTIGQNENLTTFDHIQTETAHLNEQYVTLEHRRRGGRTGA